MCSIDVLPSKTMYEIELSNIKEGEMLIFATEDSLLIPDWKVFVTLSITVVKKCFPLRYAVIGTSRWLLPFNIHSNRDQRNASTLDSNELIDNFGSDGQVTEYLRGLWINLDVRGREEKKGRKAESPFLRERFIWLNFMLIPYRTEL